MKIFKAAVATFSIMTCFGSAFAADLSNPRADNVPGDMLSSGGMDFYSRLDLGFNFAEFDNTDETNAHGRIGFGADFDMGLRLDVTASHSAMFDALLDPEDILVTDFMANAYYGAEFSGFEPFLGVGIGAAMVDIKDQGSSTGLAYAGHAGVATNVSENIDVELGYRYLLAEDVNEDEVTMHTGTLGLRYSF